MSARDAAAPRAATAADTMAALRRQYGTGLVELTGTANALHERHLTIAEYAADIWHVKPCPVP